MRVRRSPAAVTKEAISLRHDHHELKLANVRCTSCGNSFTTRSFRSEIVVDVCSNCHPAYTGVQRSARSGSRIERFEQRRQSGSYLDQSEEGSEEH